MKQRAVFLCLIFFLLSANLFSEGSENKPPNIGRTMREMMGAVSKINQNLSKEDYFETSVQLMELAKLVKPLTRMNPPKGSKEKWDRIFNELINNTFLAIGAAGNQDKETIEKHLKRISQLQQEGHKLFR